MKVRSGFVSNSSSSSFVMAIKPHVTKDDIVKMLNGGFALYEGSTAHKLCKELVNALHSGRKIESMRDLAEEVYNEELFTKLVALKYDGFDIYCGSASDEQWDQPLLTWLCMNTLMLDSDDIIIIKDEAGY